MLSLVSAPSYFEKRKASLQTSPPTSCTSLSSSPAAVVLCMFRVSKGEGYKELHVWLATNQGLRLHKLSYAKLPLKVIMQSHASTNDVMPHFYSFTFRLSRNNSSSAGTGVDLHSPIQTAASQVELNRHSELRHWITEMCSTAPYLGALPPLTSYEKDFLHLTHLYFYPSSNLYQCSWK